MFDSRVWFITGSSTGFGRALVDAVLAHGDQVVATARDRAKVAHYEEHYPEQALSLSLDVTNFASVRSAVDVTIKRFGRIDVLVNNAGYGLFGAIEELDDADIRKLFDTNVFGTIHVTQAVLPHMRQAKHGHIINLSSVGGFAASIGFGGYNASKFAVEGFSEALAGEVSPLGIKVTIIEPGAFRTDFAGRSLRWSKRVIKDYVESSGRKRQEIIKLNGQQPGNPVRAAAAIIQVVEAYQPPLRLVLGTDALQRIRAKLSSVSEELIVWEETILNTGFEYSTLDPCKSGTFRE